MKKHGFTIAELLIVVAIISVLVGISIPILNTQLEKSRQAVDLSNARSIASVLANAANDGTIEFTKSEGGSAWVYVSKDEVYYYIGHRQPNSRLADITINGQTTDNALFELITNAGLTQNTGFKNSKQYESSLFVKSNDDQTGWSWYKVWITKDKNGNISVGVKSGPSNTESKAANDPRNPSSINNSAIYADGSSNMELLFH